MKRLPFLVAVVFLLSVSGAASTATAGSSEGKLRIDGRAELFAPNFIGLTISYKCRESLGTAELSASAFQPDTQATAFSGEHPAVLPCTGRWQTLSFPVANPAPNPPAFQPGAALAQASLVIGGEVVLRERHIRIAA